jgi:hypothetical protein
MGNVIGQPNSGQAQGTPSDGTLGDSSVTRYIKDWALNNYQITGKTSDTNNKYSDFLLKRACCTGQKSVTIPMLGTTTDSNGVPIMKSYSLKIPTKTSQDICKNLNIGNNVGDYNYIVGNGASSSCQNFYNQYSVDLLAMRQKNYISPLDKKVDNILYGTLPESTTGGSQFNNDVNAFSDCNCINSIFNVCNTKNTKGNSQYASICENYTISTVDASGNTIDPWTLAQNLDNNLSPPKSTNICLNIVNNTDVALSGAGNSISQNQSCNINQTTNGGTANGGTANGGTANGGTANGGTSNGGTSNGGTANGGTANGGTANGGTANSGTTNGGTTNGGTANGGIVNANLSTINYVLIAGGCLCCLIIIIALILIMSK